MCIFFVDFFPKFFFRLKYAARQAIAKHMENYSFYQSSFSPLNDEIKFSRADTFPEFVDFFPNFF